MQGIKKTVLFCNPNGVFIQLFANHEYVINYLKMVEIYLFRAMKSSSGTIVDMENQQARPGSAKRKKMCTMCIGFIVKKIMILALFMGTQ